jgi:hypothetical protein
MVSEGLKMKLRLIKIGMFVASVVGLALWLSHKDKPNVVNGPAVITTPNNTVVVQQPGKPPTTVYQPQPDSTVISTDSNGNVTVSVKAFGIGFDPGIGAAYSDKLRLSLDSRLLFYKRLGLNVGLAFSTSRDTELADIVKPFAAVSYALPFSKLSNTSVYLGATLDRGIIGGVRVKL